jgi:hypothetical protein
MGTDSTAQKRGLLRASSGHRSVAPVCIWPTSSQTPGGRGDGNQAPAGWWGRIPPFGWRVPAPNPNRNLNLNLHPDFQTNMWSLWTCNPSQSARGLAHSKTLRAFRKSSNNAPASWTAAACPAIAAPATEDPPPLLILISPQRMGLGLRLGEAAQKLRCTRWGKPR